MGGAAAENVARLLGVFGPTERRFYERTVQAVQRVDDRVNDPYDRRRYNAYRGVWRDEDGSLYQLTRMWHPALWWEIFRPDSLWRGMRLSALRSFWASRKVYVGEGEWPSTEEGEGPTVNG